MAALTVQDITKRYGDFEAVRGASFELRQGECFGILGPNGAGKSTTLKICLAQTAQDTGRVTLLGHAMPQDALAARARVGVVAQTDNLDPDFDCIMNLRIYAKYFGQRPHDARVQELLEFAGLAARATERIDKLSGGMQRRLTLARALVNDPDFIFLDEPTTGLDPQARHLIWERLRRLQENGKTLLLTTHFMEEAERLCDRIAIMDQGRVIATGTPDHLIAERVEREVVELSGARAAEVADANRALCRRIEKFGNAVYCYADDGAPLATALREAGMRYTHRPANLEDVFLRLTGRDLRE